MYMVREQSATLYNLTPPLISITVNQHTTSQCFLDGPFFLLNTCIFPPNPNPLFSKYTEFLISFKTFYVDAAVLRVKRKLRTITPQSLAGQIILLNMVEM